MRVDYEWRRGGFNNMGIINATITNLTDRSIGNFKYDTVYYGETKKELNHNGSNSLWGEKEVQKLIGPGETRTIEINDGFISSDAVSLLFQIVDYDFID